MATADRGRGSVYLVWAILAVPALIMAAHALSLVLAHDMQGLRKAPYLRWTGIVSCVLLVVTMSITPLTMLNRGGLAWWRAQRRYLGVASFAYAALHLIDWLAHANPKTFLLSFVRIEVLPGWIGFFIMLAMALTSNDRSVRSMGPRWKALQRWVYLGAALVFLHWLLTAETPQRVAETLILSAPIILLSIWRFGIRPRRARG